MGVPLKNKTHIWRQRAFLLAVESLIKIRIISKLIFGLPACLLKRLGFISSSQNIIYYGTLVYAVRCWLNFYFRACYVTKMTKNAVRGRRIQLSTKVTINSEGKKLQNCMVKVHNFFLFLNFTTASKNLSCNFCTSFNQSVWYKQVNNELNNVWRVDKCRIHFILI